MVVVGLTRREASYLSGWLRNATIAIPILLSCLCVTPAGANNVGLLFLSSYHPTFNSFGPQVEGVTAGLEAGGVDLGSQPLNIEFMDTKRFPGPENKASFRDRLALKLARTGAPEILIVADDNAFQFALSEQDGLFAGSKIVFLGVNNVPLALSQNQNPRVTGVIERPSFDENIAIAEGLLGPHGVIAVISDNSNTGRANLAEFQKSTRFILAPEKFLFLSLEELSFGEFEIALKDLDPGSVIFLLNAYRDRLDLVLSITEAVSLIETHAEIPFLHPWSSSIGVGSLGGMVISHLEQGREAGRLAALLLDGVQPTALPVQETSPNVLIFDHAVMRHHGIEEEALPAKATFINKPLSVFLRYQSWIFLSLLFIAGQSIAIVLLAYVNVRRKEAEQALADSEKRFRTFAESSSDWMWEMDREFRLVYLSDRFEEITGIPVDSVLGLTRWEITNADTSSTLWQQHTHDLKMHRPFRDFVHEVKAVGGDYIWIRTNGTPIFGPGGTFQGYRGTATNITAQRMAEMLRDQALVDAERASQAKTEFLATMSHEFRTPLNAILGFSEVLREQMFGPLGSTSYQGYANDIHQSGQHMLALINEILDFSAVEAGKRELSIESIVLEDLFNDCRRNIGAMAEENGVTLSIEPPPRSAPPLVADRRAIFQILLNLLSNAVKFTDEGGAVTLYAHREEEGWRIGVQDTGVGISEEQLPMITEPFQQAQNNAHVATTGHGLGLAIVNALVRAHNGNLSIDSIQDKGTLVSFIIPDEGHVSDEEDAPEKHAAEGS